jgi:hypothetical protein
MSPSELDSTIDQSSSVFSGLICYYAGCSRVFLNANEAALHAEDCHGGFFFAKTCNVREVQNEAGEITLVLVPEAPEQTGERPARHSPPTCGH